MESIEPVSVDIKDEMMVSQEKKDWCYSVNTLKYFIPAFAFNYHI